ncbi:MAG: transcriptional repressor [Polyangiaceae bacterium]|nr:transcriptional repressor [Polyangiaceae bacterium]
MADETPTDRASIRLELRGLGLRATAPRVAVLQLLRKKRRPFSHSEVVEALGDDEWDRATIFRNLVKLVSVKLARIASQMGGVTRYEATSSAQDNHLHAHFSCKSCKTVSCLVDTELSLPVDENWRSSFANAEVQVLGVCPDCLAENA